MQQNRITERIPLLNEKGELTNPGYATSLLFDYDKKAIKAPKFRIKEWDYYFVGNENYGIALTIADNGYMGLFSASLLNFKTNFQVTKSAMVWFPMGKTNLPSTSEVGDVEAKAKDVYIRFTNDGKERKLFCKYNNFFNFRNFEVDITLSNFPKESMVIATPFPTNKKAFYYNQKINCMDAKGYAKLGPNTYSFDDNGSLGLLDWGRGVWTYKNTWYWGSLSTILPTGQKFGFNIGYGFGDTSAATENMLFLDGVAHKLSQVTFNIPTKDGKDDYMSDWTFTSDDGRFEMDFKPVLDRYSNTDLLVLGSLQHQVFGYFTGKAILDDGTEIVLKKAFGFAEKVSNKW